jgi:hypothetical protein
LRARANNPSNTKVSSPAPNRQIAPVPGQGLHANLVKTVDGIL